jgi:7-cyano-7-deazaguanine synthase
MANLATKYADHSNQKIKFHAPLIEMSKAQIITTGLELGVDYSITHSCYDPAIDDVSCGNCDACLLRLAGFEKVGIKDPIDYINAEHI